MITREADYAIRTIVYLSRHYGKAPITTTEISEKAEIPYRFLRKISHQLVESGLVGATRGKQGGIFLKIDPDKLSLLDVLKIFDERSCQINICCESDSACSRSATCTVCKRLKLLQEKVHAEFASIKFSEL
jgi:Rrf2 family protein